MNNRSLLISPIFERFDLGMLVVSVGVDFQVRPIDLCNVGNFARRAQGSRGRPPQCL